MPRVGGWDVWPPPVARIVSALSTKRPACPLQYGPDEPVGAGPAFASSLAAHRVQVAADRSQPHPLCLCGLGVADGLLFVPVRHQLLVVTPVELPSERHPITTAHALGGVGLGFDSRGQAARQASMAATRWHRPAKVSEGSVSIRGLLNSIMSALLTRFFHVEGCTTSNPTHSTIRRPNGTGLNRLATKRTVSALGFSRQS